MKTTKILMTASLGLMMTACGSVGRGSPDEFEVVSNSALVVPPQMHLAPPKPGQTESRAIAPNAIAKEAIFPKKDGVKSQVKPQGAELDVLKKMNVARSADVRSNAGRPNVKVTKKKLLIAEVLEMEDGSYAPDNIKVERVSGGN